MEDKRYRDYFIINNDFWHLPYIGRVVNSKYEDLHYIVSADGENYTVKPINK